MVNYQSRKPKEFESDEVKPTYVPFSLFWETRHRAP